MSDKKRRWFQIHLSTAVVLMFVAGILIAYNVMPRHVSWYDPIMYGGPIVKTPGKLEGQELFHREMLDGKFWLQGWPLVFSIWPSDPARGEMSQANRIVPYTANGMCGLLILLSVAIPLEWRIRRREARKP